MQALKIDRHGPVTLLSASEVPPPEPGPGEILVAVQAAGLNSSDAVSAEGRFEHAVLPRVLGRDFAGRIVQGADALAGRRVWGSGGDLGISLDGTHAEYVVLPEAAAAFIPDALTTEQAAAVGVPFVTAWTALIDCGGLKSGEWVVIAGAAGAVGGAAVQIAAAHGANVIALVKNVDDERRLDRSKIAAVAHSEQNDLAAVVREATNGAKAQLALNGIGAALFEPLLSSLADGGRMAVFSALVGRETPLDLLRFYRGNFTLHGVNTVTFDCIQGARILNKLAPLFASGAIAPPSISARYPLSRAAEAYGSVSKGGQGKTVLVPERCFAALG